MTYEYYLNIDEPYEFGPSEKTVRFLKLFSRLYQPEKEDGEKN